MKPLSEQLLEDQQSEGVCPCFFVNDCSANDAPAAPSLTEGGPSRTRGGRRRWAASTSARLKISLAILGFVAVFAGCGQDAPPPQPAEVKPDKPAVPEDVQSAAQALLGQETTVLLFGDLAKTGKQQFLAANVVPKSTRNSLPGTIITRAVVGENHDGKWAEIFRGDEYLKNSQGFMGLTPMNPVNGWRLDYEQDPEKGLILYFTPLKNTGTADPHVLPIGIRWNPANKRYQSLDRSYEHFLNESPSLNTPRSTLR
jgi:hypothetical protein